MRNEEVDLVRQLNQTTSAPATNATLLQLTVCTDRGRVGVFSSLCMDVIRLATGEVGGRYGVKCWVFCDLEILQVANLLGNGELSVGNDYPT